MKSILLITAIALIANLASLVRTWFGRLPWRRGLPLFALTFAFAWFELSPTARAVMPPPDQGYSNENTAEGEGTFTSISVEQSLQAIP